MNLAILGQQDKNRYHEFVTTHAQGVFLQSWEWGSWQEQLGKRAHRFFVTHNDAILLSTQVIETTLPHLGSYFYIPYGPLTAQDQESGTRNQAFQTLLTELQKQFPNILFIRIEPTEIFELESFNFQVTKHIQPGKTLILDATKPSEQLLSEMHPKTRYNIKVAEKHGVVVSKISQLHDEHTELLIQTTKRQGYKSQPARYFSSLTAFFGNEDAHHDGHLQTTVFEARHGNKLLTVAVMIDFGRARTYLFGGSSQEYKNVMAPYALHWNAIQDAQALGLSQYDFWGIETATGATPGFVRFKLGFGGTEVQYPAAVDIMNQNFKYQLYKILRKLQNIL